ncbi:MAG: ABC transporter permease [Bryobacteraceae bacterium]|nr:ABC transporter permease [Bryobacteraceae bacterium]
MNLRDLFVDTFRTLWGHKLRTFLTMFGIGWGVISITLMVAAGEGLRVGQKQQSDNLGKDLMIIFSGRTSMQVGGTRAGRKVWWRSSDPDIIKAEATDCQYVLPELGRGDVPIRSSYNSASLLVSGSYPPFAEIRSITMGDGRFYSWSDQRETRRVAVLGSDAAKQLFAGNKALGETIRIGSYPYLVIGIMQFKEQDSSYDGRDVNKVFVPFSAMLHDFPNKPPMPSDSIDQMLVTPKQVDLHEACQIQVRRALARIYNFDPLDKEAVPVWDTVENVKRFNALADSMKYFLGAVGVVTLFLGGIGVMNVMLVAVRERTREIGVRKAVGATRGSILLQFFAETVLIVFLSGGLGMGFAFGLCALVNRNKMPAFFAGLLPAPEYTLLSIALLGVVAIGAAMYPASRAASIDPIEALRHEAGG